MPMNMFFGSFATHFCEIADPLLYVFQDNQIVQSGFCFDWPRTSHTFIGHTWLFACTQIHPPSLNFIHLHSDSFTWTCKPLFSRVQPLNLHAFRHELFGVFMRNWDESEETGNQNCSVEEDHRDAKRVCKHLGIPLYEADFVDQYWTKVFTHFVAKYSKGLTPNPDLECNRSIKFGALLKHAQALGADRVATGHYARITPGTHGMSMSLYSSR